ncbi:MAG: MOSC domain-containing protein [Acidobacteria bacterium]|nr:MOSC domain-containing protein [Acidobacteriota bacterium]
MMSTVVSIQTGKIRSYDGWRTATYKDPVQGEVFLGTEGFEGDQQADRRYHGGPDKAALVYSHDHYAPWHAELFPDPLPAGAFGENILVAGLREGDVCVGDVYELGQAKVQVSQPRQPCGKQARRWGIPDLVQQINRRGWTGWYLRVLREGHVQAGDRFELVERPHPEWVVTRAHDVMHFRKKDADAAAELASCPALSEEWVKELRLRVEKLRRA